MFRNKSRGFTLLEIIVALFIFSIVSIIIVSALHNVLGIQSAVEKKMNRLTQLQIALLFLSQDLTQTINRPITNVTGAQEGFVGTANIITLTHAGSVNPSGELLKSTLQRTRYEFRNKTMQRVTWPVLDQAKGSEPITRVLLNSVNDLRFEYLDNKNRFQKMWPPPDQPNAILPRAVRVSLNLNDWGKIIQTYIVVGSPDEKTN